MVERVVLAHVEPFRLGALEVRPATRELLHGDGRIEVLEPRVMQVLIALARAGGHPLTRDELTTACWEGRVVGEDAINRVMSRLRRVAENIGAGSLRIETLTRVGYRLIATDEGASRDPEPVPAKQPSRPDRRAMLAAGVVAVASLGAGGAWIATRRDEGPPPEVAPLLAQARHALDQGTAEGTSQALALRRRVTELAPDYADGWAHLATSYAIGWLSGDPRDGLAMRARAQQAAARALALDPKNPYARLTIGMIANADAPRLVGERHVRSVLAEYPDNDQGLRLLGRMLLGVGRCRDAAAICERLHQIVPLEPVTGFMRILTLWAADRLDDADRAAAEAAAMFPTHFGVWFTRYYLLLYTGRASEALAMSADIARRPTDIADWNFAAIDGVARAMISGSAADVAAAMRTNLAMARRGVGYAENTMQFASALGEIDAAFGIAQAYYFDRGFAIGNNRYEPERRMFTPLNQRHTRGLFLPSTVAMRADARFGALTRELGLDAYWRDSGVQPDCRSG